MRISVVHSTSYRYSGPVYLEPHTIRLRPREDASQRLLAFALDITPAPAGRSHSLDQDGNVITHAWFEGVTEELVVSSSFQVETLRENPFDFLLLAGDRDVPVQYDEALRPALVPYLRNDHDPAVREFARQIAVEADWHTVAFLTTLNRKLFQTTQHVRRHEGLPHPPARMLAEREGSCRDTAVLFCAACRAMGIAARFVSGYERDSALDDSGDLHAWAEVYLQGGGWRGYDPSRGLAVGASHVPVAAAADAALAAPVSGSYRGNAKSAMQFSVSMQVG
jgi:transglutaminase-like putative cysteine protease